MGQAEIEESEFNLNLPRYVDTFESELALPLARATAGLGTAASASSVAHAKLSELLRAIGLEVDQ